ncbi:MAG: recombinase RecT [Peptococcaceae bacterium]|nr:recombinase RecT [Peptococcaceae bacterium]MBQ2993983.1 recombinase RecT [Peptococcaceae bacterium]
MEAIKEQAREKAQVAPTGTANPSTFSVKQLMTQDLFKNKFEEVLGARAPQFIASMVNMVGNDRNLQGCDSVSVISSCLVAATLDLPIDKNLGYAWIVPYKDKGVKKAQFQMGYRGYVQLALRSGQYKSINVIDVHEGELVEWNPLTEELVIDFNKRISNKVIGYAAYFELLNGFKKSEYWDMNRITMHKNKFSKSDFGWKNDFDAMARKTVLRSLLSHWGILSIQMQNAVSNDMASTDMDAAEAAPLVTEDGEIIDIESVDLGQPEYTDEPADAVQG